MKLIIQIPCYNEADSLPDVLAEVPRTIPGVDEIEVVVIDDGSDDGTAEVAWACGADHVIRHPVNRGLAAGFRSGLDYCRRRGADVAVNTDGDGQYRGEDIPALIAPVLQGQADVVVGNRDPAKLAHFSPSKRMMQHLGSRVVSLLARTRVPDATSGFRAYSRQAIMRLTIETTFSHSLETLVQASWKGLEVMSRPVGARLTERRSRLASSTLDFVVRSLLSLMRVVILYRPLALFWSLGLAASVTGTAPVVRFLWFYAQGDGRGHIQSLVIGGTLLMIGFACLLIGLLADQVNGNRRLLEEISERVRGLEMTSTGQAAETKEWPASSETGAAEEDRG